LRERERGRERERERKHEYSDMFSVNTCFKRSLLVNLGPVSPKPLARTLIK
jgi:hypothetical protein